MLDKAAAKKEVKHEQNYRSCKVEGCDWVGWGGDAGLKTHVDAKHKGVTFRCDDCGKMGFSTKGAVTRHYKNACPMHAPLQGPPHSGHSGRTTRRSSGSNSYCKEMLSIVNPINFLVNTS